MAPINWLEILEWIKTIASLGVMLVAFVTLLALGVQVVILFSAGKTGFGLLLLVTYVVGLFFLVRWIRTPEDE